MLHSINSIADSCSMLRNGLKFMLHFKHHKGCCYAIAWERGCQGYTSFFNLVARVQWALCTTQSHGTKLYILVSKLRSGTSKTMQLVPVHLDLPLFWKSHCATCSPVYIILYHVTGSCKGPIDHFPVVGLVTWLLNRSWC